MLIDDYLDAVKARIDAANIAGLTVTTDPAEARLFKSGHGDKSIRAALATSTGAGDAIPNGTLRAVSGAIGQDGRTDGASHIVLNITATAHLPGTE